MREGKLKYFIAAISSAIIWGFFSIPLRSIKSYPPHEILYYRIFTSLALTWLIILVFRKQVLRTDITSFKLLANRSRQNIALLIFLAGICITGNWFTFIYAINNVSLKSAAFAYMVCPLITALGGFFILKEHLTTVKFIAIGIAISSILILARGSFIEVLWSVFIASLYAFYLLIQRAIKVIDKLNMLGIQLFISSLLIMPLFMYQHTAVPVDINFWLNILLIASIFTVLPLFLSLYALTGMPSSTMGIIIYINPVVSFSVAFFYFHEGISQLQVIAYCLLLAAVVVFNWEIVKSILFKKAGSADLYVE